MNINELNEEEKVVLISAIMYAGKKGFEEFILACKNKDHLSIDDMKGILRNIGVKDEIIDFVVNDENNKEVVELYADNKLVSKGLRSECKYEDEFEYSELLKALSSCCCNEHHYEFSQEQKGDELIIKDEWGKEIVRKKIK